MASRLSDMVHAREGQTLLDAICVSSGQTPEQALNAALRLYHEVLTGAAAVTPSLHEIMTTSGASRAEVLELMGHV